MPEYALGKLRGGLAVVWYDDATGQRHRHALGTSDALEAARRLTAFVAEKNKVEKVEFTVGQLWDKYKASLGDRPSAITMGWEWRSLETRFGKLLPSQVTEEIVLEHTRARRAQLRNGRPIKDGTIWTELGRLRMVFAWAIKKGLLERAPYIERPQASSPRELFIAKPQLPKLLHACGEPHLRLFVLLAWTTGARTSALLELKWERVDFDRGLIRLSDESADTGRPMKGRAVVPMNGTARAALLEAKAGARTDFVVEWAGQQVGSIKKGFKAAAVRCGMPWASPHVLRHSAAVAMAEARIPMEDIAQFLGHEDAMTTRRVYAKFSPEFLSQAASALELEIDLKLVG